MHANGGSVVIEAREPARRLRLPRALGRRSRSSNDGTDCGASADLLMNLEDIEVLAMAAGGYGVPASQAGRHSPGAPRAAAQ